VPNRIGGKMLGFRLGIAAVISDVEHALHTLKGRGLAFESDALYAHYAQLAVRINTEDLEEVSAYVQAPPANLVIKLPDQLP
jgi:hypothetical protein